MPEGCNPGCALYRKIDESDVFFLFWSTAAKQSEWVIKEVRYAIGRHRGDEMAPPEIVPVMIEGPPPVVPPPELKDLHFDDKFLYFLAPPRGSGTTENAATIDASSTS
jgi:TIR domain